METLKERMGVISQRWSKLSKKEKDKLHKEIDAQMAVYQQELADFKAVWYQLYTIRLYLCANKNNVFFSITLIYDPVCGVNTHQVNHIINITSK